MIYPLPAVGTAAVHAVAVVDGVLFFVAKIRVVVTDGNVVALYDCTWRYVKEVSVRRTHASVVVAGVLAKRFLRQLARCRGWRYLVCSGVILVHDP